MTEREKMRQALLKRMKKTRAVMEQIDRDEASYNANHLPPGEEPLNTATPQDVAALAWLDQQIAVLESQAP